MSLNLKPMLKNGNSPLKMAVQDYKLYSSISPKKIKVWSKDNQIYNPYHLAAKTFTRIPISLPGKNVENKLPSLFEDICPNSNLVKNYAFCSRFGKDMKKSKRKTEDSIIISFYIDKNDKESYVFGLADGHGMNGKQSAMVIKYSISGISVKLIR